MYTASVTINLGADATFARPQEIYAGSFSSNNISSGLGSAVINLPATMHSGSSANTHIVVTQIDNSSTTRAKFSCSYSVAGNCQTATIYFRDVTGTLANGVSVAFSYIVVQNKQ